MTTKERPATDAPYSRRYKIFWNEDGEYESELTYNSEQLKDIDEIVFAVVRGITDESRFDITITREFRWQCGWRKLMKPQPRCLNTAVVSLAESTRSPASQHHDNARTTYD